MLAMFLITDFSHILIDVKDNFIILPKPVSSQTFLVARLRNACCVHRNAPVRLVSTTVRHSSSVKSAAGICHDHAGCAARR